MSFIQGLYMVLFGRCLQCNVHVLIHSHPWRPFNRLRAQRRPFWPLLHAPRRKGCLPASVWTSAVRTSAFLPAHEVTDPTFPADLRPSLLATSSLCSCTVPPRGVQTRPGGRLRQRPIRPTPPRLMDIFVRSTVADHQAKTPSGMAFNHAIGEPPAFQYAVYAPLG
jgi:hypothetical protein